MIYETSGVASPSPDLTLYDSPMGYVIKMLVSVFGPRDFALTAPVCEHIDDHAVMARELALDMAHGLVGKRPFTRVR